MSQSNDQNTAEAFREIFYEYLWSHGILSEKTNDIRKIGKPPIITLRVMTRAGRLPICTIIFRKSWFVIKRKFVSTTERYYYEDPNGTERFEEIVQRIKGITDGEDESV
jgi:hypothetical protein